MLGKLDKLHRDPVFKDEENLWWWYDETRSDANGPYPTEEKAREALDLYVERL